ADAQCPTLLHTWKPSGSRADRQRARCLVVGEGNGGVSAAAVVEVGSLVLIQSESTARARIDEQGQRRSRLLARVLDGRPHRDDGARADEERHARERRVRRYAGSALERAV